MDVDGTETGRWLALAHVVEQSGHRRSLECWGVFGDCPDLGAQEAEEPLGSWLIVEVEVDEHVVGVFERLVHSMVPDSGLLARRAEAIERLPPLGEVADGVFNPQSRQGGPFR